MAANGKSFDVAIAGGSFAGLSLALALTRSDTAIRVAVVDRTPPDEAVRAASDGRATALAAASRRLFEALRVWPALAERVQPILDIDITDSPLGNIVRPRLLHFDSELRPGEPAAFMVENHVLRAALIAEVRNETNVIFIAPGTVAGFDVDETGVAVALGGGGEIAASLLVAADGRRSAVRRAAGIKVTGWKYDQVGIVATIAHERPHDGLAIQHFLPAGPFAILPLTGNRSSIVWTEEAKKGREIVVLDDEGFMKELTARFGNRLGTITLAGPRAAFRLDLHVARSFVGDRLALIGDAAHGVHPLAGQGLNIGLRDVAALAEVIVEGRRLGLEPGDAQGLARYERWRRFDAAFSGLAMDALNRLFSNDSAPLRVVRSLGLGLVERTPALKRFFVHEAAGLTGEVPMLLRGELP